MSRLAFVTGGTGFVGAHLVAELLARGWRVVALVRDPAAAAAIGSAGAEVRPGDITDPGSLARAMPRSPDAVFHVAASTSVWSRRNAEQTLVNVEGTRNVLEAAMGAGTRRFVYTSSFIVWGFVDGVLDEDRPWQPGDGWINYIRTKRQAETLVKDAVAGQGLDAVICNPAHILGPGDRHNWSRVIRLVDQGRLPGVPPGGGAFADVREVARAHVAAFERGRRGQNYILGGPDTQFLDLIAIIGKVLGKDVPSRATPAILLRAVARLSAVLAAISGREPDLTPEGAAMVTHHIACDSGRARRELAYRFTPVRDLVQDSCEWMREEGLLQ